MAELASWYDDDRDDYDDDSPCYWSDEQRESPMFGCACENALCVDTVCAGCIEVMKEQDASGRLW
jgi:hypothetical protein